MLPSIYILGIYIQILKQICAIISEISMLKEYMSKMRILIFWTHSYKDPSRYLINHINI